MKSITVSSTASHFVYSQVLDAHFGSLLYSFLFPIVHSQWPIFLLKHTQLDDFSLTSIWAVAWEINPPLVEELKKHLSKSSVDFNCNIQNSLLQAHPIGQFLPHKYMGYSKINPPILVKDLNCTCQKAVCISIVTSKIFFLNRAHPIVQLFSPTSIWAILGEIHPCGRYE